MNSVHASCSKRVDSNAKNSRLETFGDCESSYNPLADMKVLRRSREMRFIRCGEFASSLALRSKR